MNKIIKSLLFLIAFTPLLIDKGVFFPYTSPKSIFLRTILVLTSILFIAGFIFVDKFRGEVVQKVRVLFKNSLFISITSFVLLVGVSVIFSFNKYFAFWGSLERAEGFVAFIYYFILASFLFIFFNKKNWLNFFKLNLLVTLIVFSYQIFQFASGMGRPGPFLGNPTFLAGYLIFSMIFSVILFGEEKGKFWKYFSVIIFILSILGIFIAETRGTILGLAVGGFITLIYGAIKGKSINYKKFNLRKISIIILCISIAFSAIFFITRKSEVWQKVPGLSRIAVISLEDSTTNTRLLNQKIALKTVDPRMNGAGVLFVGYGQDNFGYAYGKYFNAIQFESEMVWFDRAHNKFLDVLVMNGILGFIAYISIFVIIFRYLLKKKEASWTTAGLLFGITAYLVHLFFVFDQVTTYIQLFTVFAFVIYINSEKSEIKEYIKVGKNKNCIFGIVMLFLFIFSSLVVYFKNDIMAYYQMKKFVSVYKSKNASFIINNTDSFAYPFTSAQREIREKMLSATDKNFNKDNEDIVKLTNLSIQKGEEYISRVPYDPVFRVNLANDYTNKGKKLGSADFLLKGEKYFKDVVNYSPERPDANYGLGINLFYQKKYGESFMYLEKSFNSSQKYYLKNKETIEPTYPVFLKYFLQQKDLENIKVVASRLDRDYPSLDSVYKLIDYIEKTKTWPTVRFE